MKKAKKKKKEILPYEVTDSIYGANWFIFKEGTLQEAYDWYGKYGNVVMGEIHCNPRRGAHFFAHSNFKGGALWFKTKRPAADLVAHECLHATWWLIKHGMECSLEDNVEEVFAYYLQFLVKTVMKDTK